MESFPGVEWESGGKLGKGANDFPMLCPLVRSHPGQSQPKSTPVPLGVHMP
jgi:hypothetical protein